jgi:hypothetical protein
MATATAKITRDDLEAKLRDMSGDLDDTVEAAKPTVVTTAVAAAVLASRRSRAGSAGSRRSRTSTTRSKPGR